MPVTSTKKPTIRLPADDKTYAVQFQMHANYEFTSQNNPDDFVSEFLAELIYQDEEHDAPDPPDVTTDPDKPETKIIGRLGARSTTTHPYSATSKTPRSGEKPIAG